MHSYWCEQCRSFHPDTTPCVSVASACCGADATQVDVVSPRCGDGQIADKARELYLLMKATGSERVSGFILVGSEIVRISIQSQINTDHAHDGP